MRGGWSWALVAILAVSGCAGLPELPGPDAPDGSALPALPDGASMEQGKEVARDGSSVSFAWSGSVDGVGRPAAGLEASPGVSAVSALDLPADAPLRVDVTLQWNGSADLQLSVFDDAWERCVAATAEGGILADVAGTESCTMWVLAGPARAWHVAVVNDQGGPEPVPFEVSVRVGTFDAPPRYDVTAGPVGDAVVPDPTVAGPFEVASAEYDFGVMVVEDRVTKRPTPIRVIGAAHFPVEGESLPVVLFLHGRHSSCTGPLGIPGALSHCRAPAPVGASIQSYHGYDDAAALLASHGYVVVSVDANDINALDSPGMLGVGPPRGDDGLEARAALLMRTLDELKAVHEGSRLLPASSLDALRGRLDLSRIGLMGHSRGAEGVTRAPSYAIEHGHWSAPSILAVYSLAGTARLGLPDAFVPPVRAPTAYASVVPVCDGDVYDLGNLGFFDEYRADPQRGPLVHLLFMGANHAFYNSQWLDGDDADRYGPDTYCGMDGEGYGRLTPEDQARQQLAYLPAFFRLHLGNETAFAPLFTGEASPPASACPEGFASCPGLVHVSAHPLPARMLLVEDAATDEALATNDLGGASAFDGFSSAQWCAPLESEPDDACARPRTVGHAPRLRLAWTEDAAWRTFLPGGADLGAFDTLSFRLGVDFDDDAPPGGFAPSLRIVLEDAEGKRAEVDPALSSAALFAPPGDASRHVTLNQVRVPLAAFEGVDLARVAAVELRFSGATPGIVQVADLAAMALG